MENKTKILTKLSKIMGEIGTIEKDKTNTFQKYEYLSESAIKRTIQPLLVKYGVVLIPRILSQKNHTSDKIKNGEVTGKETFAELDLNLDFYDSESGEYIEAVMPGHGIDSGDKGIYKAITGAIKYTLTTVFLIPTESDPENDEKPAKSSEVKPKTEKVGTTTLPTEDIGF